ncbi:MAG: DUF1963 domain-containing protein [Daejeonella sp.]
MEQIDLKKQGITPDAYEECSVWSDNTTLHWMRQATANNYVLRGREEIEKKFETEEEAEAAARAKIAELQKEGFILPEERAPLPPEQPSKPKKVGVKSAWFNRMPEQLLAEHAKFLKIAKEKGLEHRFAEIEELMRPGIDFSLEKTETKGIVSRIGGVPDLAPGQAWPEQNCSPLTFVAQILISDEIKALDLENVLPQTGLLSFFAQLSFDIPDYTDYGVQCVVLYSETIKELVPVTPPSEECVLNEAAILTPKLRLTIPHSYTYVAEELNLNSEEDEVYNDDLFLGSLPSEEYDHTMLGWGTAATQHDMSRGNKRFLAQFASDHRINFEMGDYNTLRFYIEGDVINASTLKSAVCTLEQQ